MKRLHEVEDDKKIPNYVLLDWRTGEVAYKADTEAEALSWYGRLMRVMGEQYHRRLILMQRRGFKHYPIYDQNETFSRSMPYL